MTIEISGTFANGKYPRVLHDGNRFRVKTVTPSSEATNYPGLAVNLGTTADRWRPFTNAVLSPLDLSSSDWTVTRFTVGADEQTLDEGTDAATTRFINQALTFTAVEWVVGVKVERQTMDGVRVQCNDGTSNFLADIDLRDGTVDFSNGGTWSVTDLGNDVFEIKGYFTAAAGTGFVRVLGWDAAASDITYTGTNRTIKVLRVAAHQSLATLAYDLFSAQSGDVMAVAAHNLGDSGGDLIFQHDSNSDATWTTIDQVLGATDNSPVMAFFDAISSAFWRIAVRRAVLPEIGVFRVGAALQFERPFYGGFTVPRMNRQTDVTGNLSGSGELLGRSKKRTVLSANYEWSNLTYDWVRANLDTPTGLIQSAESEPLFVAWRPSETQDVEYLMRATVNAPRAQGLRDLHNFSMSGEAYAYE